MEAIVPFELCLGIIRPFYAVAGDGRPPVSLEKIFRMLLVQEWYQTSDEATEDLLYENTPIRNFVGIDLAKESVPDETTLWRFRDLLIRNALTEKIFEAINAELVKSGIMCKSGTIVDATLIEAPTSTKNKDKKRDSEMSSTRKNGKYHFGLKSHIGVDAKSGLIHSAKTTTAKVADITEAVNLFHGEEETLYGDAGFVGLEKREDIVKKFGEESPPELPVKRGRKPKVKPLLTSKVKILVNKRRMKIERLPDGEEKTKLKAEEKAKSQIRSKVEFPFRYVKQVFGFKKTRVRGLKKNNAKLFMLYALTNLCLLTTIGVILKNNRFLQDQSALLKKNGSNVDK